MGYGDVLLAAGAAERLYKSAPHKGPVVISSMQGKARWHPLWQGNPAIYCPQETPPASQPRILFGGGCLPYLLYPHSDTGLRYNPDWNIRDYRPSMYLTGEELARAQQVVDEIGPYILLAPPIRDRRNVNRRWPQWHAFVAQLQQEKLPLLQFHFPGCETLPGVRQMSTPTFRDACALVARASLLVAQEGGVQIAAGAFSTPAIILWGNNLPATTLGYPEHDNIWNRGMTVPCGTVGPCVHCATAWQVITAESVAARVLWRLSAHGVR